MLPEIGQHDEQEDRKWSGPEKAPNARSVRSATMRRPMSNAFERRLGSAPPLKHPNRAHQNAVDGKMHEMNHALRMLMPSMDQERDRDISEVALKSFLGDSKPQLSRFETPRPEDSQPINLQLPKAGQVSRLPGSPVRAASSISGLTHHANQYAHSVAFLASSGSGSFQAGLAESWSAPALSSSGGAGRVQDKPEQASFEKGMADILSLMDEAVKLKLNSGDTPALKRDASLGAKAHRKSRPSHTQKRDFKNDMQREVQQKIQRLRMDEMYFEQFQDQLDAANKELRTGTIDFVQRNINQLQGTNHGSRVRGDRVRELEQHRAKVIERSQSQKMQTLLNKEAAVLKRAEERSMKLEVERQHIRGVRAAKWLAVLGMVGKLEPLARQMEDRRKWREETRRHERMVRFIQQKWRQKVLRQKLQQLSTALQSGRKMIWILRLNLRIRRKRSYVNRLITFLKETRHDVQFYQIMQNFRYTVCKVQKAWRNYWVMLSAQIETLLMQWTRAEHHISIKGKPESTAPVPQSQQVALRRLKIQILREDLRLRKRDHVIRLAEWRKRMAVWKDHRFNELAMADAKKLLRASSNHEMHRPTRQEMSSHRESSSQLTIALKDHPPDPPHRVRSAEDSLLEPVPDQGAHDGVPPPRPRLRILLTPGRMTKLKAMAKSMAKSRGLRSSQATTSPASLA